MDITTGETEKPSAVPSVPRRRWSVWRSPRLLRGTLAFLLLTLSLATVAHYYLTPPLWGKNFGLFDDRYFYGPNAFFLDTSLRNGEFPLWNPLVYSGMPFAADPQSSVFYPPHILRSLLTPAFDPYATAVSLQLLLVLHLLMGGMGVYVLAREYRLSTPAAITGALVFMLGPFSIEYSTEFYIFPLVMAWAPWLLWLARRALHARSIAQFFRYTAWTALFFGISTLVFFPQLSLYMGVMLFSFSVLDGLFRASWPRSSAWLRPAARTVGRGLFLLVTVALLGAMIGAAALLPAWEFGGYSVRTVVAGLVVAPWTQNLDPLHLLKCLVIFPGNTWLPQGCRAAGIGSLLAVVAAFSQKKRREAFVFIGMYLLMTDLTLGPPWPAANLLHAIDILNITVSPWRAGFFSSLCLAMVVAFGIDAASEASRSRWKGALRTTTIAATGLGMIALLLNWVDRTPLFETGFLVWLLPSLTMLAMGLFIWVKRPRLARALLAVLISLEIVVWGSQMLPAYVTPRIAEKASVEFGNKRGIENGNFRTAPPRPNWNLWTLDAATNGYGPIYVGATRQILCSPDLERHYRGQIREEEIEARNQRGNLFAKRSFWLARQWVAGPLPEKSSLFPAATTVYLPEVPSGTALGVPEVSRPHADDVAVSDHVERIDLAAGPELNHRIRTPRNKPVSVSLPACEQSFIHSVLYVGYASSDVVEVTPICTDEQGKKHSLYRPRTTRTGGREQFLKIPLPDCKTSTVNLHWPAAASTKLTLTQAYVLKDLNDENDRIKILRRGANSVDLKVHDLPEARILTFIDSAYPGWNAEVDGVNQPILLANDGFKAIQIPAGSHSVRFAFTSRPVRVGLWISGTTAVALLAALALLHRRKGT